jgi:predicted  nucleic acid-binding Zn-ribbon protein
MYNNAEAALARIEVELERLTGLVRAWSDANTAAEAKVESLNKDYVALKVKFLDSEAEVERLRNERDEWRDKAHDLRPLRAEVERLRKERDQWNAVADGIRP